MNHHGTPRIWRIDGFAPNEHNGRVASDLTPEQRATRSRLAAHVSWAKTENRTARTAPARAARDRKFEDQVDPEGKLSPDELAKRVKSARKAHFTRLSLKAQKVRKARRAAT